MLRQCSQSAILSTLDSRITAQSLDPKGQDVSGDAGAPEYQARSTLRHCSHPTADVDKGRARRCVRIASAIELAVSLATSLAILVELCPKSKITQWPSGRKSSVRCGGAGAKGAVRAGLKGAYSFTPLGVDDAPDFRLSHEPCADRQRAINWQSIEL
jgi:hypothetical protein